MDFNSDYKEIYRVRIADMHRASRASFVAFLQAYVPEEAIFARMAMI